MCTVGQGRQAGAFYGSELLGQAALQWIPAYCLNKQRFNWQDNVDAGRRGLRPDVRHTRARSLPGRRGAAAEVSARGEDDSGIGYAPTAATGWAIAFDIDKANNGGQQMSIKLNASCSPSC